MKALLDLSAPIVPAQGLGGLAIGRNVSDYGGLLADAMEPDELIVTGWKYVYSLYEARYRLGQVYGLTDGEVDQALRAGLDFFGRRKRDELVDYWSKVPEPPSPGPPAVEICVDIRDGLVFALRALEGYEGALFERVTTGMTGAEAMVVEPRLELHWDGLRIGGVDGLLVALSLDGQQDDLEPEEAERATVHEICVYDPARSDAGRLPVLPAEIGA